VKELLRYCWLVALTIGAFAYIFINVFKPIPTYPLIYSLFVALRFYIQGLANVIAIVWVHKHMTTERGTRKKWVRYLIGYLFSLIFFFITDPVGFYLTGKFSPGFAGGSTIQNFRSPGRD
jgi:hypothetical protein